MIDTLAILCTIVVGFCVVTQEMSAIRRILADQKKCLGFIAETILAPYYNDDYIDTAFPLSKKNGGECDCRDKYSAWLEELNKNTAKERIALSIQNKPYLEGYAAGVEFATRKALENYNKATA